MNRYKRGWFGESHRHYLAAKGVKTQRYYYTPTYVAGDLPLIAGDAVGTAGAATVGLIPLAVLAGGLFVGARGLKRKTEGKSFFAGKYPVNEDYTYTVEKEGSEFVVKLNGREMDRLSTEKEAKEMAEFYAESDKQRFQQLLEATNPEVRAIREREFKKGFFAEKKILVRIQGVNGAVSEELLTQKELEALDKEVASGKSPIVDYVIRGGDDARKQFAYAASLERAEKMPDEGLVMQIEELKKLQVRAPNNPFIDGSLSALEVIRDQRAEKTAKNIPIMVKNPEKGRQYPVSPEEVKKVLAQQGPERIKGIKAVEFDNPKGEQKEAWAQYVNSRGVVKVFSQPKKGDKLDGRPAKEVNAHMKEYVLPHETNHHYALKRLKLKDRDLRMAEARADAGAMGAHPDDKSVKLLKRFK